MTCDDVVDLVSDHLPAIGALRALDAAQGALVLEAHEHLRGCAACAEVGDELLRTVHALREQAAPVPALSPDFADRVMAALPPAAAASPAGARAALPPSSMLAAGVLLFVAGFGAASLRGPASPAEPARALPVQPDGPSVEPAPAPTTEPTFVPAPARQVVESPGRIVADASDPPASAVPVTNDRPRAAPPVSPRARPTSSSEQLERYVEEAGLVVRALGALEQPDPHWLGVLSRRVEGAALIAEGDRLLVALDRAPASEDAQALRPLITATQVVLRKVRRTSGAESSLDPAVAAVALDALRREVAGTGLLDAYRDLADGRRPAADEPPAIASGPTDPL